METVEIKSIKVDALQVLTPQQAWHYRIIPKTQSVDTLVFFIDAAVTTKDRVAEEMEMLSGKSITLEPLATDIISEALSRYYRREQTDSRVKSLSYSAQSEDFLYNLITEAKNVGSSDIHIESYIERCRVRIRIDGMMVERYVIGKNEYPSLINKIKILANLDIAEKRLPQDGRIFFTGKAGIKTDIRVSVLPTLHGEKVVLRLLSNDATNIDIYKLGFSPFDLHHYLEGIKRPNGMMLISGPTGSGKTTTLYATLKVLNKETRNILTIEDPIEYTLEGINQVQLKESIGLNFGSALRTFLRQDPDVIMVGEIRDPDTASMAIRASLTGHLVLSTIHTNSAWGTVSRLADMQVPPFLVANTLHTTVAQRLLRRLCTHCKTREIFSTNLYPKQFKPYRRIDAHFVPRGCEQCFYTGYKGRKAVYEVIPLDGELADAIKKNLHEVGNLLQERGIKTLAENAFELFEEGETSIEEIYPLLFNF
jgi:general secretion pathway protein E/type IV pilus assembly protein PilB